MDASAPAGEDKSTVADYENVVFERSAERIEIEASRDDMSVPIEFSASRSTYASASELTVRGPAVYVAIPLDTALFLQVAPGEPTAFSQHAFVVDVHVYGDSADSWIPVGAPDCRVGDSGCMFDAVTLDADALDYAGEQISKNGERQFVHARVDGLREGVVRRIDRVRVTALISSTLGPIGDYFGEGEIYRASLRVWAVDPCGHLGQSACAHSCDDLGCARSCFEGVTTEANVCAEGVSVEQFVGKTYVGESGHGNCTLQFPSFVNLADIDPATGAVVKQGIKGTATCNATDGTAQSPFFLYFYDDGSLSRDRADGTGLESLGVFTYDSASDHIQFEIHGGPYSFSPSYPE